MRGSALRKMACIAITMLYCASIKSQFLMDMIDTTKDLGKGVLNIYRKFDHIQISGYMQPQYQLASDTGIISYAGGSFPPSSNSRFMLRRGRVRVDYAVFNKNQQPSVQFVFQFDGSERGVVIRDFWGRVLENRWSLFTLATGMFARPFGYEINLSSIDRESPERGRMSQILMRTERDIGAMLSLEPRKGEGFIRKVKIDAGYFNGQGLTGTFDYDRYKDFITQVYIKPTKLGNSAFRLSGGASMLLGGIGQPGKYRYYTKEVNGQPQVLPDSSASVGSKMPRTYYGLNTQVKYLHAWGATELRAEYWWGTQTSTRMASETPPTLVPGDNLYVRQFNGAFIALIQGIVSAKNQLLLKFDFYDPNTRVKKEQIQSQPGGFTYADVKFTTMGFGFLRHFGPNLKFLLYYDWVTNEETLLNKYSEDVSDNVFTCRLQFRF